MEQGKAFDHDGRHDEAVAAYDEAIRRQRELLLSDPRHESRNDLGRILTNRAIALNAAGRHEDALASAKEAIRIRRELLAEGHEQYRHYLSNGFYISAEAYWALGDGEKAEAAMRRAIVAARKAARRDPAHLAKYVSIVLDGARRATAANDAEAALRELDNCVTFVTPRESDLDREAVETFHEALLERREAFEATSNCKAAAEAAEDAAGFARRHGRDDLAARALVVVADSVTHTGEWDRAVALFREAAAIFERVPAADNTDVATLYARLGTTYELMERWGDAIESYSTAIDTLRVPASAECSDARRIDFLAGAHADRADCYREVNTARAIEDYREALALWASTTPEDPSAPVRVRSSLAEVLCHEGRHDEAAALRSEAAAIIEEHGLDDEDAFSQYTDLEIDAAACVGECGDVDAAIERIDRVIARARTSAFEIARVRLAGAHSVRARILRRTERQHEALNDATFALALMRDEGKDVCTTRLSRALLDRSCIQYTTGAIAEALASVDECIALLRAGIDSKEAAKRMNPLALSHRGDVLEKLGRCAEAAAAYDEVLTFVEGEPVTGFVAQSWCDRGTSLLHVGRYEESVFALRRATAMFDGIEGVDAGAHGEAWRSLGEAFDKSNSFGDAAAAYQRALEIVSGNDALSAVAAKTRLDYGIALTRADRDAEALPHLEAFVEAAAKEEFPSELVATAHHWRGTAFDCLGRCDEAADAFAAEAAAYKAAHDASGEESHHELYLDSLVERVTCLLHCDRRDDAESLIEFVLRAIEGEEDPGAEKIRARILRRRAEMMQVEQRCDEAVVCLREAVAIAQRASENTGSTAARVDANDLRNILALELTHVGAYEEAVAVAETAIREAESLAENGEADNVGMFGETWFTMARIRELMEDPEASLAAVDKAIAIWTPLAEAGAHSNAVRALMPAWSHRARCLVVLERDEDARASAETAVTVGRALAETDPSPDTMARLANAIDEQADILEALGESKIAGWYRSEAQRLRGE